jgi:hypothetical protein
MKIKILISGAFVAVAMIAVVSRAIWYSSDWRFVRRATGFEFPAGTEFLAQYDNAEWFVVSIARLPEDHLSEFAQRYRFSGVQRGALTYISARSLPPEYREVPKKDGVLGAKGENEYQAWEAILDPTTRRLWIHISYPDPGGFNPGHGKKPPNQALEPTTTAVTICAGAQLAPAVVVAHL